nr:MAG TPA: hypothetical protein [Caudoviricetes sp.]
MINVQVDETSLLNLFMDRLEYWTTDNDVLELYENYLKDLIDGGCFEGAELDINLIIDNLYINDTTIMSKEMLDNEDIEVDDSEKVWAKNEDKDLYLVSTY